MKTLPNTLLSTVLLVGGALGGVGMRPPMPAAAARDHGTGGLPYLTPSYFPPSAFRLIGQLLLERLSPPRASACSTWWTSPDSSSRRGEGAPALTTGERCLRERSPPPARARTDRTRVGRTRRSGDQWRGEDQ
jgi:hypothetical protein